jgi:hypothetical protein
VAAAAEMGGPTISSDDHQGGDASDAPGPRLACILGIGRMGTNHLQAVLRSIPEIDSRNEIFNPNFSYGLRRPELKELSRRAGKRFKPVNDEPKALKTIARRPGLVLDCLVSLIAPRKHILVLKVLLGQLTIDQIVREIVDRPDTIVVFIRRRPIDVFISKRKALHLKRWLVIDTTDLKIAIRARDFIDWWNKGADWYLRLEAACWRRGRPLHRVTYEDDIDRPPGETAGRFCAILESHGLSNFTIPDDAQIRGHVRQDRNQDVADRISNWPEFERQLKAKGALDKAFSPFPHFTPNAWDYFLRLLFGLRALVRQTQSRVGRLDWRGHRGARAGAQVMKRAG